MKNDSPLVLSLFPGIGLLDMAFEEEGFCVVRGPDLLWGGDVRRFHPPAGKFDGLIGGPPCKGESALAHLNGTPGMTMRHEFARVLQQASPAWWVMEAVQPWTDFWPGPDWIRILPLSPRALGHEQSRKRYFHSNLNLGPHIEFAAFEHPEFKHAVLAGHGTAVGSIYKWMAKYSLGEACRLQGLPEDFTEGMPFTRQWKYEVIGNGVPLPMGRAIAKAVRRALGLAPAPSASEAMNNDEEPHGGPREA